MSFLTPLLCVRNPNPARRRNSRSGSAALSPHTPSSLGSVSRFLPERFQDIPSLGRNTAAIMVGGAKKSRWMITAKGKASSFITPTSPRTKTAAK